MWVQCARLFLLLHVVNVQAYSYGQRRPDSQPWQRNTSGSSRWAKSLQDTVKLRHSGHSKFPHLDGVLGKLNKYKATSTTTTPRNYFSKKYSSKRWEDINDNYEDFDYHESELDDELTKQDYEENDDEYLEEDEDDESMQAEEATPAPTTSQMTQYKWSHYGTRSRVEESRRYQMQHQQALPGEDAARSAVDHIRRVNLEGKCNNPKPKVISIQNEHPSPGKRYLPHCTVLYRCAEDTGCCQAPDTKCQPKRQTLVQLYFYTSTLGHVGSRVEKLAFHNHTECSCLKIGTTPVDVEAPPENLRAARSGLSMRNAPSLFALNSFSCNCPEVFIAKMRYDGKCICDCGTSNMDCNNMKRGKEHFSLRDRKCIIEDKCGVPVCEYGAYLRSRGRCPRKQEKLEAYAGVTTARNLN